MFEERGKADLSKGALQWIVDNASDPSYVSIARLRLAGLAMQIKAYDDALKVLEKPAPAEFEALAEDRRGDVAALQGKRDAAVTHYQQAYKLFDEQVEYRRLVEIKLNALGVEPVKVPAPVDAKGARQ